MHGYKKRNGVRVPIYAPEHPVSPPERLTLPEGHPCCGCPIIDLNCFKPFCFLPNCLRHEFDKPGKDGKSHDTETQSRDESGRN